jgi:periplasmic copper chaperone A
MTITTPLIMQRIGNALKMYSISVGLAFASMQVYAEIKVDNAWAQATTPSQTVTGVFLTLQSSTAAALIGAESAAATAVEIHEMKMNGENMRMQTIKRIPLPVGQPVKLQPGGYHIMLLGLKRKPLKAGETMPLTLKIEQADGKLETKEVVVPVRSIGPGHKSATNTNTADHAQHMHH